MGQVKKIRMPSLGLQNVRNEKTLFPGAFYSETLTTLYPVNPGNYFSDFRKWKEAGNYYKFMFNRMTHIH